jgi:hypothetical protein
MEFKVLDRQYDEVIKSDYIIAKADYDFAIKMLVPRMTQLPFQRDTLRSNFYKRLGIDITNGCIMPPLTIAYSDNLSQTDEIHEEYFYQNIDKAFVLDGIQRLNTLKNASEGSSNFLRTRPVYLNILICDSMERLLYRMVTLNNGQRPMSARHQIEILASKILDFDSLPIVLESEKQKGSKRSSAEVMNKDIVIKGYLAFASESYNIDNQKIIEEKMNDLIAEKIINSSLIYNETSFVNVMTYISKCLKEPRLLDWFLLPNNFIGFCSVMLKSFPAIIDIQPIAMSNSIELFEKVLEAVDVSKIKLGLIRRKIVAKYFSQYERLSQLDYSGLLDYVSQEI